MVSHACFAAEIAHVSRGWKAEKGFDKLKTICYLCLMSSINLLDQPDVRNRLDQCIHCGLCLPACPTYVLDHVEMDSPRGRIALIRAAADGRVEVGGAFQQHIDLCLGCRACETACPSGVEYGFLLETARTAIAEADRFGLGSSDRSRNDTTAPAWFLRLGGRIVQWIGLRQLMPHRPRLRLLARLLAAYQRLGLANVAQRLTRLPAPLQVMIGMVPSLTLDYPDMRRPAPPLAPKRGAVAFFTGCVQDAFLANVNAATIRVLQRNGYEVHFPEGQTCCGAASLHTGDAAFAAALARKNVDAFGGDGFTAIINNAGGCGATLKEYAHLLRDDPRYAEPARVRLWEKSRTSANSSPIICTTRPLVMFRPASPMWIHAICAMGRRS